MGNPSIGAVVVSYNPSREILQNVAILSGQVGHVVVVDNTPNTNTQSVIDELEQRGGCTVIRNRKNLGIATALNIGVQRVISLGCEWIITFDQDSQIGDGFVQSMLSTFIESKKHMPLGMLCPMYEDKQLKIQIPVIRNANGDIVGCMTSGSMIEAKTFEVVGPFEEQLFIDFVDHEYCMRMRILGFHVLQCSDAVLLHSLGRITLHPVFKIVTNHSPKRRYYINRNRLALVRRYFHKDREWALTELKGLVMDSVAVLITEEQKLAKAAYMLRALYDGMFNRLGRRVVL